MRTIVVAAVLALACQASAQDVQLDTTGKAMSFAPGYAFGSNVGGYLRVSKDLCEIRALLTGPTPKFDEARAIYISGKNSMKSNGSPRTLQGMATENYAGEPFWDMYTAYFANDSRFTDTFVNLGFGGVPPITNQAARTETIIKGLESNLQFAYLMHEMDETDEKIRDNSLTKETGAPHNVDETFALYAGSTPDCSLWGLANKRAKEFGTLDNNCIARVNLGVTQAHNDAYRATVAGNRDAFGKAYVEIRRQMTIPFIQATMRYASLLDEDLALGRPYEESQAEGYAFFRTIEPLVAKANATSAATIRLRMWPGNKPIPGNKVAIWAAFQAAFPGLGVSASEVGEYGFKQPGLNCDTPASNAVAGMKQSGVGAFAAAMAGAGALAGMLLL